MNTARIYENDRRARNKWLLDSAVANLISVMSTLTPPAAGQTTLTPAQHTALDMVLAANWH